MPDINVLKILSQILCVLLFASSSLLRRDTFLHCVLGIVSANCFKLTHNREVVFVYTGDCITLEITDGFR